MRIKNLVKLLLVTWDIHVRGGAFFYLHNMSQLTLEDQKEWYAHVLIEQHSALCVLFVTGK